MTSATSRRHAREVVLRILYQAEITGEPIGKVAGQVASGLDPEGSVRTFVTELAAAVEERSESIDSRLRAVSRNWALERMASTDRNVLRAAVAELIAWPDTDARVVIDEAVSIAKRYGTDDSGAFVNGILDRVARDLRPGELTG